MATERIIDTHGLLWDQSRALKGQNKQRHHQQTSFTFPQGCAELD